MSHMFPKDICPFCGAKGECLDLKQTEYEYRRYRCVKCHNNFAINEYLSGLREVIFFSQDSWDGDEKVLEVYSSELNAIGVFYGNDFPPEELYKTVARWFIHWGAVITLKGKGELFGEVR